MTRKIIAIGGVPAVGKSSIMRRFMQSVDDWTSVEPEKLVSCEYSHKLDLYVIGKYLNEPGMFPGGDMLSMAVQPQAIKFIQNSRSNVLFEGDRLFSQSFLEFLADQPMTDFKIAIITANVDTVGYRHHVRKDTQNEQFKRSRETKIDNVRSNMTLMGYTEVFTNETLADQTRIVQWLINELVVQDKE
jgi:hypothetical protein